MKEILTVVHLLITFGLVGLILMQKSEGGGLGIGGPSTGIQVRGTATLLTRMTTILGAAFMINILILAILETGGAPGVVPVDENPFGPLEELQLDDLGPLDPVVPLE